MTIKLVQTSSACPEQYDAFLNGELVGYLRLRHGVFRVECPAAGGEEVYRNNPRGDGCFEPDERDYHLTVAALSVANWTASRLGKTAPAYEIVDTPPAPNPRKQGAEG